MFLTAHSSLLDVYATALLLCAVCAVVTLVTLPEASRPTPTVLERWLYKRARTRMNRRQLPVGFEPLPVRGIEAVRRALAWSWVDAWAPVVRVAPTALAALTMLTLSSLPLPPGHADYLAWVESAGLGTIGLAAAGGLLVQGRRRRRPIHAHVVRSLADALRSLDEAQSPTDGYEAPGHRVMRALDDLERALTVFADKRFTSDADTRRHLREEVNKTVSGLRVHKRRVLGSGASPELRALLLTLLEQWSVGNYEAPPNAAAASTSEAAVHEVTAAPPRQLGRLLAPRLAVVVALGLAAWLCEVVGITNALDTLVKAMTALASVLVIFDGTRRLGSDEHPVPAAPGRSRRDDADASQGSDTAETLIPQQLEHTDVKSPTRLRREAQSQ
ncbi:MAG: hypothetical protein ACJ74O_06205 [Frankiaceae bacterium]